MQPRPGERPARLVRYSPSHTIEPPIRRSKQGIYGRERAMRTSQQILIGAGLGLIAGVLLALVAGGAAAQGGAPAQAGAPGLISYQGHLSDAGGQPYTGSATLTFAIYAATSGGGALWEETQSGVAVADGFFTVQLGSVTPLAPAVFSDPARYLEVRVDTGGGPTTLPRQRLTAVPYALQAEVARRVAGYMNLIVVAQSGGDYTSVAAALESISDSSASNRYLVMVAPGVYAETDLLHVRPYVHLQGSGANATLVQSARTGTSPGEAAATARLDDNGRISAITIRNEGTGTFGIGVWSAGAGRGAVIEDAVIEAVGAGGTGHYAAYLSDAEPIIRASALRAGGATGFGTGVNAALGVVNVSGGFPQPLIEGSTLLGGSGDPDGKSCAGNSGTGFGLQYVNAAALIRDSYLCGDRRAIFGGTNGVTRVEQSKLEVSSTGGSFLVETTSAAAVTIAGSGVFYAGNKHTGTGGLTCVHSYKANYTAASDGATAATACN